MAELAFQAGRFDVDSSDLGMRHDRDDQEVEDVELELLLEAIFRRYGHDFRGYARASLKRRIMGQLAEEKLENLSALQARVLRDRAAMARLFFSLSIHVTSMFRDPSFYRSLRTKVLPLLRTYPDVRLWVAGCATGEEAYSVAITLEEEGIYDRCLIYATDMNDVALDRAREGIYPLDRMQQYTANYQASGARASFSEYYRVGQSEVMLDPRLKDRIVFAHHNLATDASFNEFQVILCRNVMIYFDGELRSRVVGLFRDSLTSLGVLGLGLKENLRLNEHGSCFEFLDRDNKLYRRMR